MSTWIRFVKIWAVSNCQFNANFWTYTANPNPIRLTGKKKLFSIQGTPVLIAGSLFSLQGFPCKPLYFPVRDCSVSKNLFDFISLTWKLHKRYCYNEQKRLLRKKILVLPKYKVEQSKKSHILWAKSDDGCHCFSW